MTRSSTILTYHGVGKCPHEERPHNCNCISTEAFAEQMRLLAASRQVVSLETLIEGNVSGARPAVAITFDDGYRNVLANAVPILGQYGFVATIFVPTKWIGRDNFWDADSDCFPLEIADENDLRTAERHGITIESHGHAHINLEQADFETAYEDLKLSISRLHDILGRRPRYLAYPYGRQSRATWEIAEKVGFSHAFLCDGLESGAFAHERLSIDGYEGRIRFRLKTAGGYLARRQSRLGTLAASLPRTVFPKDHMTN